MPSHRRRGARNTAIFVLGLALPISATSIASLHLSREADRLRSEQVRLSEQQTRLRRDRQEYDARLHAIEREEDRLRQQLAAPEISAEQQRLIERAWKQLTTRSRPPAAAPAATASGLLVQSKAGKIYFPELLGDGRYSAAAATVERLQTEIAYGRLFAALQLGPAERDHLARLLTEREMAKQDIFGLEPDASQAAIMQQRVTAAREWRTRLKDDFGPEWVQQIATYDGGLRLHAAVDELATRSSYTATPLTPTQAGQLFTGLVATVGTKAGARYWSIPDRVIEQMQAVLMPAQLAALRQIQEEQLALIEARDARVGSARDHSP